MRIISMRVSNMFGLKDNVTADFTESNITAIVGRNGSGKSSLMDSARFSLFGEPSPARSIDLKDCIRKGEKEGTAELIIEAEDSEGKAKRWRITRKLSLNSKGACLSSVLLESMENETWTPVSSSLREASEKIAGIILPERVNVSSPSELVKQAKASVDLSMLIYQGGINKILSVSPSERLSLIASALNLQDSETIKQRAKELKRIAEEELKTFTVRQTLLKDQRDKYPPEEELVHTLLNKEETSKQISIDIKEYDNLISLADFLISNGKKIKDSENIKRDITFECNEMRRLRPLCQSAEQFNEIVKTAEDYKTEILKYMNNKNKALEMKNRASAVKQSHMTLKAEKDTLDAEVLALSAAVPLMSEYRKLKRINDELERKAKEKACLEVSVKEDVERLKEVSDKRNSTKLKLLKILYAGYITKAEETSEKLALMKPMLMSSIKTILTELANDMGIIDINALDADDTGSLVNAVKNSQITSLTSKMSELKLQISENEKLAQEMAQEIEKISGVSFDTEKQESNECGIQVKIEQLAAAVSSLTADAENIEKALSSNRIKADITAEAIIKLTEEKVPVQEEIDKIITDENFLKIKAVIELGCDTGEKCETLIKYKDDCALKASSSGDKIIELHNEYCLLKVSYMETINDLKKFTEEKNPYYISLLNSMKKDFASDMREVQNDGEYDTPYTMSIIKEYACGLKDGTKKKIDINRLTKLENEVIRIEERIKVLNEEQKAKSSRLGSMYVTVESPLPIEEIYKEFSKKRREEEIKLSETENEIGSLKKTIELKKRLDGDIRANEKEIDRILPSVSCIRALCQMSDGNNFARYINDKVTDVLLYGVNECLAESNTGWKIISDNGELYVDNGTSRRSAASLSGGESTLISCLLLQQISKSGCLWIDEGLTMLDDMHLENILSIIGRNDNQIIVVTHDSDLAREFPHVWKMENGQNVSSMSLQPEPDIYI